MDDTFELFNQRKGKRITKIELVEESTIGRTYLVEVKPEFLLNDFRIHFTMVHRHLILSKIASIFRKRRDFILLEADPTEKEVKRYQLEILPRQEEKRIKELMDLLGQLEPLEIGNTRFEEAFIIRTNDPDFFFAIFEKEINIIKNLFVQRNQLVRISFYPLESPSIRIVAYLDGKIRPKLLTDVLFDMTSVISSFARKGYYAKKKTVGSRIVPDKTIEKDKKRYERRFKI